MVMPRKLSSLPILSALWPSSVTLKLATGVGVPGSCCASGVVREIDELRAGAEDDAVGLRIRAIAGVAGGVEETVAIAVVQDRGAAVVAAIGVGLGEGEVSVRPTAATAR